MGLGYISQGLDKTKDLRLPTIHMDIITQPFFFLIFFIFKLYNIVLVLPNIEMNPPQVYLCSPS